MLRTTGTIQSYEDGQVIIKAACPPYLFDKWQMSTVEVWYEDGRTITPEQRGHIYATLRDISRHTGNTEEREKWVSKREFIALTGSKYFSLRTCTVTTAYEFLNFLIDLCIEHGIITDESLIMRTPDTGRYLYKCLACRKCAICGRPAQIHHVDTVGMGNDREEIVHLGKEAIALCPEHHKKSHDNPDFLKDHYVYGIKLDEHLCKVLGLNTKPKREANR